ncbi:MAG: metal-dependent hydrolase [Microbacterium sp.]
MIPTAGTIVTYPDGATTSTGTVVHVADAGAGRSAVVLDVTAFHPVDTAWPDQPADRGILRLSDGTSLPVLDAVVGAAQDDVLLLGEDVPVRTGTEGWTFVVAHVVDADLVAVGDVVVVEADAAHRAALSAGHTACHLASLALDAALADAWRKEVAPDALGAPAFDSLAIEESRIVPNGSLDRYRIGKSLRRRGFDPDALGDTAALAARVDALLARWIDGGGDVRIERDAETLAARRTWVCGLPSGDARIPCGGTHVDSLARLASVTTSFETIEVPGGVELVMTTTAVAA